MAIETTANVADVKAVVVVVVVAALQASVVQMEQ